MTLFSLFPLGIHQVNTKDKKGFHIAVDGVFALSFVLQDGGFSSWIKIMFLDQWTLLLAKSFSTVQHSNGQR